MRYEVTTSWAPEEVIEHALNYFGPGNTGLEVVSQTSQGVIFQGGGGYVAIQIQPAARTTVEIETREWDYPVRQFMARISRRRWLNWWRRRSTSKGKVNGSTLKAREPETPIFTILNNQGPDRDAG